MITLTSENATAQIDSLLEKYPDLAITEASSSQIRLRGSIHVYRRAVGFTVNHDYNLELLIPIDSDQLPSVYETDNNFDVMYQHRYRDGKLCLETDTAIRLRFYEGIVLLEWMDEFVEPYFFSYEYYQRFGSFPFGERPHGFEGMLDTYKGQFHESNPKIVIQFLKHIAAHEYRGHQLCPCGSNEHLRNCHGKVLYPYMTDRRKQAIVSLDITFWAEDIKRYDKTR